MYSQWSPVPGNGGLSQGQGDDEKDNQFQHGDSGGSTAESVVLPISGGLYSPPERPGMLGRRILIRGGR